MAEYAHPEVLVATDWVVENAGKTGLAIVEVDVDTAAYSEGHVPGAIAWNWTQDLCDTVQRDIVGREELERLLGASGITPQTTIVLYGDNNNWFAAWAFWQLKIYGHEDVRLMDGGRKKWLAEGQPISTETPEPSAAVYVAKEPEHALRCFLLEVQSAVGNHSVTLLDVRSPDEYSGRILSPPGLPETCQRGGHIPGASNIPWGQACNEDGTFKSADKLKALYDTQGITGEKPIIAYCRIGERSSHSWFVLKYLLGYDVRNYDGSWTEWGNLVGAEVERESSQP